MAANRIIGDLYVDGNLQAKSFTLPADAVTDAKVAADAAIAASKLKHQHRVHLAQPNTAATTETRLVYAARGPAEVIAFEAGSIAAALGAATVTLDLKKNGASILTGVLTLNSANVARVTADAALATATMVDGDVLEIVVVATAGGGTLPTGLFAMVTVNENYVAA